MAAPPPRPEAPGGRGRGRKEQDLRVRRPQKLWGCGRSSEDASKREREPEQAQVREHTHRRTHRCTHTRTHTQAHTSQCMWLAPCHPSPLSTRGFGRDPSWRKTCWAPGEELVFWKVNNATDKLQEPPNRIKARCCSERDIFQNIWKRPPWLPISGSQLLSVPSFPMGAPPASASDQRLRMDAGGFRRALTVRNSHQPSKPTPATFLSPILGSLLRRSISHKSLLTPEERERLTPPSQGRDHCPQTCLRCFHS